MKKETISRITLALVLFSSAAIGVTAIAASTELARVNGTVITLQDFEKQYQESLRFFQYRVPSKKNVLDEEIKRIIGVQEAKKLGLDHDPAVVQQIDNVLYQAYLNKKLAKQFQAIHVSDDQAEKWYKSNPEIRVSHIFVAVRPDAKKADVQEAYKRIEGLRSKVNSENFSQIAQKFSEGTAAQAGGDIGWQTKEEMEPTIYKTATHMSVGSVSGIVRSQFGFHIIKLTGKKSWDEVDHAAMKRQAIDERRQEIYQAFTDQLRKHANVVVHAELLKD